MVVKLTRLTGIIPVEFESRVILDGSQTAKKPTTSTSKFESRVILDGSQTSRRIHLINHLFESRVILDGSQTKRP